jgi:GTP-binding protein
MTKRKKPLNRELPSETFRPRRADVPTLRLPLVAIVGRPNVGKSTLFNRLARARLAIVHDQPGVTRDRHYADTSAFGRDYTLVDTGGFDPESDDPMKEGINVHVRAAIKEADVIVFVTDGTDELTNADKAAVALLRRTKKPVFFAANKADSPRQDAQAFDVFRLGVEKVYPVSALHGRGMAELEGAIVAALPEVLEEDDGLDPHLPRIALIGRPNAGKSSLTNRILGEDRMLVDDKPGTTRDAIRLIIDHKGTRYVLCDTAGIRRKGKVHKAQDAVESLGVISSVRAIERAHVVVLLVDANEGVAEQDAKILGLAEERGRALIIALNKSDLLSNEDRAKAEERARDKLTFAPYAPIVHLSAKTGRGVDGLFKVIADTFAAFTKRIGTGELNRFFEQVLETHPPPTSGGKAPRLYYVTQAETAPPTFVAVTNAPDAIHFSYRRFVQNQLRKAFGFEGVPVRVHYKAKRQTTRKERMEAREAEAADE